MGVCEREAREAQKKMSMAKFRLMSWKLDRVVPVCEGGGFLYELRIKQRMWFGLYWKEKHVKAFLSYEAVYRYKKIERFWDDCINAERILDDDMYK